MIVRCMLSGYVSHPYYPILYIHNSISYYCERINHYFSYTEKRQSLAGIGGEKPRTLSTVSGTETRTVFARFFTQSGRRWQPQPACRRRYIRGRLPPHFLSLFLPGR